MRKRRSWRTKTTRGHDEEEDSDNNKDKQGHLRLYGSHQTTRYTILKATSSARIVVTLPSVYQVIPTNMTPSYRTINSITQSYVHAWIVGGTDGHGHNNIFTK